MPSLDQARFLLLRRETTRMKHTEAYNTTRSHYIAEHTQGTRARRVSGATVSKIQNSWCILLYVNPPATAPNTRITHPECPCCNKASGPGRRLLFLDDPNPTPIAPAVASPGACWLSELRKPSPGTTTSLWVMFRWVGVGGGLSAPFRGLKPWANPLGLIGTSAMAPTEK